MIHTGDCREILSTLPDDCVDCVVTSPPYFQLRDYGIDGQIGLESGLDDYIVVMQNLFREVYRVLKSSGTLWINIGDTRKDGTLMGIPWKLAIALQDVDWKLRQEIIWGKTDPMPEPAGKFRRFVSSHEHVFLFAKSKDYYWCAESTREPAGGFDKNPPRGSEGTLGTLNQGRRSTGNASMFRGGIYVNDNTFKNSSNLNAAKRRLPNTSGMRYMRDVWLFATASAETQGMNSDVKHYATFPEELPRRCILAGCPANGVVLDPFCGSGTTGKVAYDHGREFIGIELNPAYAAMAEKRIGTTKQEQLGVI